MRVRFAGSVAVLFAIALSSNARSAPPIWETSFGAAIESLTGCDDCTDEVELSFSFPFDGTGYTTVYVGTNGDVQLGSLGEDDGIDYDHWEYLEEFVADQAPSIAGFNSDLDATNVGSVHFNDLGDRAVFTWNELGTNENDITPLVTFQITLYDDGTIVLGYDGLFDGEGQDPLTDLDEGIVVGVAAGDLGTEVAPPAFDLRRGSFTGPTTIHERWCYDVADSCGFFGRDSEGVSGPVNTAFDLDQKNVVFGPVPGGFMVVVVPEPTGDTAWAAAGLALGALARARRRPRRR